MRSPRSEGGLPWGNASATQAWGPAIRPWYHEQWHFHIDVLHVGSDDDPGNCRLGLERGDMFTCGHETPGGFCPTSMFKLFPLMEVVRCGGDLHELGGSEPQVTDIDCPDGVVRFRLTGKRAEGSPDLRERSA